MEFLSKIFNALFRGNTRDSALEEYLSTKCIQSHSDLEYFVRQFDNEANARRAWW